MGAGKITVDLEARSDKWSAGIGRAEKDVKGFVDKAEAGMKSLAGMRGGGAFADVLAKSTTGIAELVTGLRTGENAAAAFGHIVDEIPIVGKFKEAGTAIREIATGEKAAREEAKKWREEFIELNTALSRRISVGATFGKHGQEKEELEIQADFNQRYGKLANEKTALKMDAMRREEESGKYTNLYGEGEMEQLKRDKLKINDMEQEGEFMKRERDQKLIDLHRDKKHEEFEFNRKAANDAEMLEAGMQEKSLRRQGKGLESAIAAVQTTARIRADDLADSISAESMKTLTADQKIGRRKVVGRLIKDLDAESRQAVAELNAEHDRKEQEQAKENGEKLKEIEASGNIERLHIQDEQMNGLAEKRGIATRSHLAEQAQIEEEHRKQVADLEKKYREDHRTNNVNREDPTLKAQLAAADEERRQKLGVLNEKSGAETIKNRTDLLKEERKMWESVGDAQHKYQAKAEDIAEDFQKHHNEALRDAQLKKLNSETFEDLKKLNPNHDTPVNLYGIDSAKGITVNRQSDTIAAQQLAAMQKQVQQNQQTPQVMQLLWQWLLKQTNGQPAEFDITGFLS